VLPFHVIQDELLSSLGGAKDFPKIVEIAARNAVHLALPPGAR
jgi:hypothetical protein